MLSRLRYPAIAAFAGVVLVGACSPSSADAPIVTTVAPTVTTTPIETTTTTSSTTTTVAPPTTTTTIPPLDRDDAATIDRMRSDLEVLVANGPRVSGSPSEAAAARFFADEAAAITGIAPAPEPVPLPGRDPSANVWVTAIGTGDRLLFIGAHLDSVAGAPGADDNGSGVVLLLELLRRLVEAPPTSLRVVVVGFGAEERVPGHEHHNGSRLAAEALQAAAALPDLMLSVDMVGLGEQLYAVNYRDHDSSFADEVVAAAAVAGIEVGRMSRGEISDHVPFARAGVLAAHLWRPDNAAWHTPDDDTVSDAALLETLGVLEALLAFLADNG